MNPDTRVSDLTEDEERLCGEVERQFVVEGDLRKRLII